MAEVAVDEVVCVAVVDAVLEAEDVDEEVLLVVHSDEIESGTVTPAVRQRVFAYVTAEAWSAVSQEDCKQQAMPWRKVVEEQIQAMSRLAQPPISAPVVNLVTQDFYRKLPLEKLFKCLRSLTEFESLDDALEIETYRTVWKACLC